MRKLLFVLLLSPLTVTAQKDYPLLLDKYMEAEVKVNEFTGAILVARKGNIIYEKAFGMADREWNIPNTLQTKFEIGSVTKQFTAAGILLLADEKKLDLTDKLSKYFPDFPKADSITIHMLLSHTSGIANITEVKEFQKIEQMALEKDTVLAIIKRQPFDFSPGSKYTYSNSGYHLLGLIIEKVTGMSYNEYMMTNVIQKAGLKNTCVINRDTILPFRAKGYIKTENVWRNQSYRVAPENN